MLQGYAMNENKLKALNRTVTIQSNIIAGMMGLEAQDVLHVINEYSLALEILDDYDHQSLERPEGNLCCYHLSYEECREIIGKMSFFKKSDVFGVEKEKSKVEGILAAVY